MRLSLTARSLSSAEQTLVTSVFGPTLPPWKHILIDAGLGLGDRPYTLDGPPGFYTLHVGPFCYPDCSIKATWGRFGRVDTLFVHEMTHVWQYGKGYNVKLSSIWAQTLGDGYGFTPGKAWNDYNVEQQASIVAKWYDGGMSASATAFPYIDKVVRRGGGAGASKTLADLATMP